MDATAFTQTPAATADYAFRAHYDGDPNYPLTFSNCEPLTVTASTVAVRTQIHNAAHAAVTTVTVGTPVHDSVTLTGRGPTATGVVVVAWFADVTACLYDSPFRVASRPFALDAGGSVDATAFAQTPAAAGGYAFRAQYNGDANYPWITYSECEPLTVMVTDTDLVIAAHADIITAPVIGITTVVTYTPPTASDEDGPVTVTCNPRSGSTFPLGTTTVTCTATDADDTPSSVSTTFTVTVPFAFGSGGSFVVGEKSAIRSVTFWGAQWATINLLSGGAAPDAFKGFTPGGTPACRGTWTAGPGNSSNPPATIGAYIAVIVTSSVSKSGSNISGNIVKVIIVKTDPGYAGNPGHAGTGTVEATLCG